MRVFYFVHHEGGKDAADGVDGAEDVDDELVVVFHVRSVDFQEIIVLAGDVVALGDLRNVLDHGNEGLRRFPAHLLEFDRAEDDEAQVQFLRVQDGDVLLDEAAAFQALEPFEDGRGGKVYAGGELLGGQAGVLLQGAEDVQVGGVEEDVVHGQNIFPCFSKKPFSFSKAGRIFGKYRIIF